MHIRIQMRMRTAYVFAHWSRIVWACTVTRQAVTPFLRSFLLPPLPGVCVCTCVSVRVRVHACARARARARV